MSPILIKNKGEDNISQKVERIGFDLKGTVNYWWSSYLTAVLVAEEILDDGVGLLLESSGDSLDDDSEIFSQSDECRKVRFDGVRIVFRAGSGAHFLSFKASPSALCYYERALNNSLLQFTNGHHLLPPLFIFCGNEELCSYLQMWYVCGLWYVDIRHVSRCQRCAAQHSLVNKSGFISYLQDLRQDEGLALNVAAVRWKALCSSLSSNCLIMGQFWGSGNERVHIYLTLSEHLNINYT